MLKKLGELFVSFARIGVLTIGGGYAMLPMMQNELVERRGWATEEEMMDYYALAQCTPGAIAVNVSTFIGYRLAGVAGGVVATLLRHFRLEARAADGSWQVAARVTDNRRRLVRLDLDLTTDAVRLIPESVWDDAATTARLFAWEVC